ncbi:flagellar motor switch phosphatase FliY [Clostridium gelidum]|uniref:Flagellar motor switch phosphatase FliY n=1 Tax=Clostridium gelidum TaxID=704125 RepID=A0ABN6IV49_9CLOT|nr:flagellar motor switch phosphatase FliY [Clostridium gelidum]BCZ44566.1 flagellar motor switch phosphatase FliY [Clostridium gelidum]
MSDAISQEEINALLESSLNEEAKPKKSKRGRKKASPEAEVIDTTINTDDQKELIALTDIEKELVVLTDMENDIIGEVGNISMGSAATALSDMIGKRVSITTPVISVTTLKKMRESFEIPNIAVEIKYVTGIAGKNIFCMKVTDAAVIANLMMGGTGETSCQTLSEIEESAVSEAMNQMMGSAATSMATMFSRKVDISPPKSKVWDSTTANMSDNIGEEEAIIQVAFRLQIEDLIDSIIMQVLSIETVKKIESIMMGSEPAEEHNEVAKSSDIVIESKQDAVEKIKDQANIKEDVVTKEKTESNIYSSVSETEPFNDKMQKVEFKSFNETNFVSKNTNSIFDVPLNIQVVLGNAERTIKEVMNFGKGTLLELNQVAGQPIELHVNGKVIAYGEVVVVDGNLAVNIIDVNKNNI